MEMLQVQDRMMARQKVSVRRWSREIKKGVAGKDALQERRGLWLQEHRASTLRRWAALIMSVMENTWRASSLIMGTRLLTA